MPASKDLESQHTAKTGAPHRYSRGIVDGLTWMDPATKRNIALGEPKLIGIDGLGN
jgi:hypothetical protein